MTADSLQKQSQGPAGRLFQKGQSGNSGGRRPGCRNRPTLAAETLGFLIGAVLGIFCGVTLGRNRLLVDVFSIYIKIANSVPRADSVRSSSFALVSAWPPRSPRPFGTSAPRFFENWASLPP
jgi:hypothetical protein